MGVYRLEQASSNRAGCANKECKDNQVKIEKGSLRFGSQYTFGERQAWSWRHWGCVTPVQVGNLKETIEGNLDYLDGYEDLDEETQRKVVKALEDGHVADEDWKGDAERNRPGKKGFRSPAATKKGAQKDDGDEDGDGSPSRKKTTSKKRGRPKKEDDGADEESAPKKMKATLKKGKKTGVVAQDEGSENRAPSPKKARAKGKKAKAKDEDANAEGSDIEGTLPQEDIPKKTRIPRKAAMSKKAKYEDSAAEGESEAFTESPTSKPNRKSARVTVSNDDTDQAVDAESVANAEDDVSERAEDDEIPAEDLKVKRRRKGAGAKKGTNGIAKVSNAKKGNKAGTNVEPEPENETIVKKKSSNRNKRTKVT